jgi:hypothetical protein
MDLPLVIFAIRETDISIDSVTETYSFKKSHLSRHGIDELPHA